MKKSSKVWALVGLLAIGGAITMLIMGGLQQNVVYFLTPSELLARGAEVYDTPLRLGGQVKAGTKAWDAESLDLEFVLTDSIGEVHVSSTGAPPAMFREGIGVVVEGRYHESGTFEATNLMVKHSNEYEAPHGDTPPSETYKSLIEAETD